MSTERTGEFDPHVAQSAETHDAHFLAAGHAPVPQWRIGGDAGAQQRRGAGEIQILGNSQDEIFVDDDAFRVAAVGDTAKVSVGEIVGEDHARTELLEASLAIGAGPVGIHQAAHTGKVAHLEFRHGGPGVGDSADDLVAWDTGVHGRHDAAPLVPRRVQVRVADAAIEDLDPHIVIGGIPPGNGGACKRRRGAGGGVGFAGGHGSCLLSGLEGQESIVRISASVGQVPCTITTHLNRTSYWSADPVLVAGSGRALMPKSRSTAVYQDSSSWALQSTHCSSLRLARQPR